MWDPDAYLRFAEHRQRAPADLLARVPNDRADLVVDLGCGPGNLFATLRARWPDAHVVAVDADGAMVDRARAEADAAITVVQADIAEWRPDRPADIVFSNAALHWVPDHLDQMVDWVERLSPGGTLAVQVPGNTEAPTHRTAAELRGSLRWRTAVGAGADDHLVVHPPGAYARALDRPGVTVDVWETTYQHRLTGEQPVLQWVVGSTLRPVLAELGDDDRDEFLAELGRRLAEHYPAGSDGVTWLPFRRIFVVARRADVTA